MSNKSDEKYHQIFGCVAAQATRSAIVSKESFKKVEGYPWPRASVEHKDARGTIEMRPVVLDERPLIPPDELARLSQAMWAQREKLTDLEADALDMLCASWLTGQKTPKGGVVIDIDDCLKMRGLKPKVNGQGRRGGFEQEQRREMLSAFDRLSTIWIEMSEMTIYEPNGKATRGRGRKKNITVQSRAFVITDVLGQRRIDGLMDVQRFVARPGEVFGYFLEGPGRQVALLSAQALKYDPYRQKWEKRLLRYLAWIWKCEGSDCGTKEFRVSRLLAAVGDDVIGKRAHRTRDRFERALDTLKADGAICDWQYGQWDEDIATERGWREKWFDAPVVIEAPDALKEHYVLIEEEMERDNPVAALLAEPVDLCKSLRQARKDRGFSQIQLAEELGIGQAYLSKIESGRVSEKQIGPTLRAKFISWLRS